MRDGLSTVTSGSPSWSVDTTEIVAKAMLWKAGAWTVILTAAGEVKIILLNAVSLCKVL